MDSCNVFFQVTILRILLASYHFVFCTFSAVLPWSPFLPVSAGSAGIQPARERRYLRNDLEWPPRSNLTSPDPPFSRSRNIFSFHKEVANSARSSGIGDSNWKRPRMTSSDLQGQKCLAYDLPRIKKNLHAKFGLDPPRGVAVHSEHT